MSKPLTDPIMCAPKIRSVMESARIFTNPSVSARNDGTWGNHDNMCQAEMHTIGLGSTVDSKREFPNLVLHTL